MPVYNPPKLQEMYNVTLNGFSTIAPLTIPTAGYVGASDGDGGIRFIAQSGGSSVGSNYAFSNLLVANTLSTSSTFTDYLSAGQIYASSLIVQSAVVVGSNTLTVLGQTFLSSVTLTGQFLISTIPGQPAQPLSAELISAQQLVTSTINYEYGIRLESKDIGGYPRTIAIGAGAGVTQGDFAVAIGRRAGANTQGSNTVAIGNAAGIFTQGDFAVAIGTLAGQTTQGSNTLAIGRFAGRNTQGEYAIAFGYGAGSNQQLASSIAIGVEAANDGQSANSIAIGTSAGFDGQGQHSIAIGTEAATNQQGEYAVAIGYRAGLTQFPSSIVLNATNTGLNAFNSGLFIAPIRPATTGTTLFYNTGTSEITYGAGGGGSVDSNYAFSNLLVADTLSTTNIYMNGPAINQPGGLVSYSNSASIQQGNKVVYDTFSEVLYATGYGINQTSTIRYSLDGSNWSTIQQGGFSSNQPNLGNPVPTFQGTALFNYNNASQSLIFAGGLGDSLTANIQRTDSNAVIDPSVQFEGTGQTVPLTQINCFTQATMNLPGPIYVGGQGPYALYSSDTDNSPFTGIPTTFIAIYGLATDFANTRMVAVGQPILGADPTSTIQWTDDGGVTWGSATFNGVGFVEIGRDVIYDGTKWYACGDNSLDATGRVLTSTDGIQWNSTGGSAPVPCDQVYSIASDGSRIIAVGAKSLGAPEDSIAFSTDNGTTWNSAVSGGFQEPNYGNSVVYNATKNVWVAVGGGSQNSPTILYSTDDGANWAPASIGEFVGSNYNVSLNVDSDGIHSDAIYAENVTTTTLYPQVIDGQVPNFEFTWGGKGSEIGRIAPNLVSTATLEVSTINGIAYPRMYFSTLETGGANGECQWDFPTAFSGVDSYSATLTATVRPDGVPILVSITERTPSYVQFSTFNVDLSYSPSRIVSGIAIGT